MRFAWWQIVGMAGDQLAWWGESLRRRSAHNVARIVGITPEDDDQTRIRKTLSYVYPEPPG
jgi:hypothetical protein